MEAYACMREALEQSAGRTNGRYATADWTPIRYLNRDFPHEVLMGFMRSAHACLVTSLRDGMNLVAKEYVCAQDPADPGVLVLSDRTGAAFELADALIVNPYDTSAVADAIQAAINMSLSQRRARHERLLCADVATTFTRGKHASWNCLPTRATPTRIHSTCRQPIQETLGRVIKNGMPGMSASGRFHPPTDLNDRG